MKKMKMYLVPVLALTLFLALATCSKDKNGEEIVEQETIDSIVYNFNKWNNTKKAVSQLYDDLSISVEKNRESSNISADSLETLVDEVVKSKGFESIEEYTELEKEILNSNEYDSILIVNSIRVIN